MLVCVVTAAVMDVWRRAFIWYQSQERTQRLLELELAVSWLLSIWHWRCLTLFAAVDLVSLACSGATFG